MQNEDIETFFISEEESGERLDKILANRYHTVGSRTYFQFLVDEHKVLLNGSAVKKRQKTKAGDEIEIEFVLTPELELKPENIPLDIVYEDEDLLIINKAPGMVVHPAPGNWTGTFVNALLFYCQNTFERKSQDFFQGKALRPGIVHRLDKETSGLLIAAKTSLAQQRLIEMFSNRRIHKEYVAICVGNPGNCEIRASIGRHPKNRQKMTVLKEGGREALTLCRTLSSDGKISVVDLILATGRTHQIRVHMKHHGTPVLGDATYGNFQTNQKYGVKRQMLHAHLLRFAHPLSNKPLEFQTEMPQDMKQIIQTIKDSD
jgi:23S rRNA pseudouridine1911/1915/1917 synthase